MKQKLTLFLIALVTSMGAWAYSTTSMTSAQDSKGNALVSGGFYRILLPSRGASVALKQNGEYVQAYDGLGILGYMWKMEADANGKAIISNPAGGYWKLVDHNAGNSKLKTNGTSNSDCTAFQMAWYSSSDKTLNLFDPTEGTYSYDNVLCGTVLSNHGGVGKNMGIYNNISDGGSIFKFERFYRTTFTFVDVNDDPVSEATVTINGSISAKEFYTNSDNPITSFATAYEATYSIDDVSKTAEEVKTAINANTGSLNVKVTVLAVSKHFTINVKDGSGTIVKDKTMDAYVGESFNLYTLFNIATDYVTLSQTSITVTGDIPSETNVTYEMKDLPFTGSTIVSPAYYAMMISTNTDSWLKSSSTDVTCGAGANPLPSGDATNWAWLLIGDAVKGYKLYNVETGKYIGGRTSTGGYLTLVNEASANSFIPIYNNASSVKFQDQTNDLWIDRSSSKTYAHTSGQQFTFNRLYKVRFALSDEDAGLVVGSETVDDFDTDYIITTSATLTPSDASNYRIVTYDGYSTLSDALENDDDGTITIEVEKVKSVTYNLTWNGTPIASKTSVRAQYVGDEVLAATTVFGTEPYSCSYGEPDVSTIGESTTTVNVALNWNGPFDFSTSYATATWYNLKINGSNLIYQSAGNYTLEDDADNVVAAGYNAFWAFLGNPVDGVQIINKEAGENKTLAPFSPPSMAGGSFNWTLYPWASNFALHWSFNYLNNVDGTFKLYNSSTTSEDPMNLGCSVELAYTGLAINYLNATFATAQAKGQYFGITESAIDGTTTYLQNGALVLKTDEDYTYFTDTYLPTIANSIKYPADGHYYRIKSSGSRSIGASYIGYGSSDYGTGLRTVAAAAMQTDASTVIKFTGSSGTYKLSTENLNVQIQAGANAAFTATASTGVDFVFNVSSPGVVTICNESSASENREGCLHEGADGTEVKGVVNWNRDANASKWTVEDAEEITLSLNKVGEVTYGTTYLPFGVTLPAGDVCAYTLTDLGNGWVRPELLGTDGKSIPAGTAVLLRGTSTTNVTATIGDVAAIGIAKNMLDGTYVTMAPGNNLVLGKYEGVVGFYKYEHYIKPNKAYIPAGSYVKGFVLEWDDDPDAIVSPFEETEEGAAIYNVAGQRLNKMQKGINIVNGKKVLR